MPTCPTGKHAWGEKRQGKVIPRRSIINYQNVPYPSTKEFVSIDLDSSLTVLKLDGLSLPMGEGVWVGVP